MKAPWMAASPWIAASLGRDRSATTPYSTILKSAKIARDKFSLSYLLEINIPMPLGALARCAL